MPSSIKIPVPAAGVSQLWNDKAGAAFDITNARYDEQGGWLFDRGIEPWWKIPADGATAYASNETEFRNYVEGTIDSCFVWTQQNTGQTYYLFEQNGDLQYFWGNKNGLSSQEFTKDRVVLDSGRRRPKANEAGTQYVPFGNRLLILNGYDKPVWFYGGTRTRQFGFTIQTPTPELLGVEPSHLYTGPLDNGTAFPKFDANKPLGLGRSGDGEGSRYSYRMSFITDTGSESPLSSTVSVGWNTTQGQASTHKRFGVFIATLPQGPDGTVARRIYRTRNNLLPDSNFINQTVMYLVKQINDNSTEQFIDVVPDGALINPVSAVDSTTIDTGYMYGAVWNGRMWLAGGANHPTRIIYSETGLPEQFRIPSYFDIGNTAGGHITQLIPYYNNLLVIRQRSIDVVRSNGNGFTISQVDSSVGTTASNTVKNVPGYGVMFLAEDGLYRVSGGLDGGSSISIEQLGSGGNDSPVGLTQEIRRVSTAALPRATAAYSHREKEYWVHYAQKGSSVPTRGIVLHTQVGLFSFRHAVDKANDYAYQFTALATDANGYFVLGTKPTWLLNGSASDSSTNGADGYLCGLHVWSGQVGVGQRLRAGGVVGQSYQWLAFQTQPEERVWQSNWINFGDKKARVFHVEAEMMSYGDNAIELEWGHDYDTTWYSAGAQSPTKAETAKTSSADATFGPADVSVSKSTFVVGTSALKDPRIIKVRWDVNTQLVDNFRFKVSSEDTFHLLRYNVYATSTTILTRNQRS